MGAELDAIISGCFPDVSVNKRLSRQVGAGERAVPAFVSDWLISRYTSDGQLDRQSIEQFLSRHLPDKQQVNVLRNQLLNGERLTILDSYAVEVDLERGRRVLKVPSLDIYDAYVRDTIVDDHELLLVGNVWGGGTLTCRPDPEKPDRQQVWLDEFRPMQTSVVDVDYFRNQRQHFTLQQWREMLIQTMGYNPSFYTAEQQYWMLSRLVPLVQPRVNLIELAPKGTGKSYTYSQLSKYSWLISGGVVTRAQLFYNMATKTAGVITRYDAVVLDEVQTIRLSNEGEVIGALKGFLEAGEFRVMGYQGNSEASFVMLANIPIGPDGMPRDKIYFDVLPSWLKGTESTALLDRIHGLVPGWQIPRLHKDSLARGMGLRADYFGEVLHNLRLDDRYIGFVRDHIETDGDLRDIKAVERVTAGLVRLLFPDLDTLTPDLLAEYCLEPAKQLRKGIRLQLSRMDDEYKPTLADIRVR